MPRDTRHAEQYVGWVGLKELFLDSVSGIVTAHDHLVVAFEDRELLEKAELLCDERLVLDELREALAVRDNAGWKLERARDRFRADPDRALCLRDYAYRPFDTRRILYHPALVWCDRRRLMSALGEPGNVALAVCRQLAAPPWQHVFATRDLMDDNFVSNRSRERTHLFPLYRRLDARDPSSPLVSNLDAGAVRRLAPLGLEVLPEELLHYVYAILHAPAYRERHRDSLAVDFPRIPPARDAASFHEFAEVGSELLRAHLSTGVAEVRAASHAVELRIVGSGEPIVARGFPRYRSKAVWLNADCALEGLPASAWNAEVGAYFPCRKWLKDRVNMPLSRADLDTYARVVAAVLAGLRALERLPELPAPARRQAVSRP